MNISESSFLSWTKGTSQTESDKCNNSEIAVRKAVNASKQLSTLNISVFAQGSYRNRTNVRQSSDVDICIRYNSTFFARYPNGLSSEMVGNIPGSMKFSDFKRMIQKALEDYFGKSHVTGGKKAFNVYANTYRVGADVVPTFEYRKYTKIKTPDNSYCYLSGVAFYSDSSNHLIVNWPDQTYKNEIERNANTGRKYKRVIRIIKRLRDKMQDDGVAVSYEIPSFLIECLVWNVDIKVFGYDTYTMIIRYLIVDLWNRMQDDNNCLEWREVNEMKYLFHSTQPWTRESVSEFLQTAWNYIGYQ